MRKKLNIQAFNCFENAKNTYNQLKINTNFDSINLSRGIVYKSQGNIKAATSIFNFIVAKPDSTSNVECKSEAYLQIGAIEMQNKRYNSALNYLNKALNLNSKIDNLEQKSAILLLLSDVYENLLDKNNAYYFLKQYSNSIDYIINSDNRKLGIEDYESFKEIERISDNIQGQEQIEQQEKANKFSKLISILAIALISILSLLSLALYKNNIIRTQTNILLEEKKQRINYCQRKC